MNRKNSIFPKVIRELWILKEKALRNYFLYKKYMDFRMINVRKSYRKSHNKYNAEKTLVFMCDGKIRHGGFADRLRGLIFLYDFCCQMGYQFKLFFVDPFPLSNYLVPNEYDWRIAKEELIYDSTHSAAFLVSAHPNAMRYLLDVTRQRKNQFHIYTNSDLSNSRFGQRFRELFKYSPPLEDELRCNLELITHGGNGDYISITFRFQQLLGDFKDSQPTFVLSEKEKDELITHSLEQIDKIHTENSNKQILVTSDSGTFLQISQATFDCVYTIPGIIAHTDVTKDADIATHMKLFVDFLMISEASKIYLAIGKGMYRSAFAWTASRINDTPYIELAY